MLSLIVAAAAASTPIDKRINWFVGGAQLGEPETKRFLLNTHRSIVQMIYICCEGGISDEGHFTLSNATVAHTAPYLSAGIPVLVTLGGGMLPLAAWRRRSALATEATAWVMAHKLDGLHTDFESHGDVGGDAHAFNDTIGAIANELHRHGKRIGVCIETAPANVSHPWAPQTPSNDTRWHSYMFNWDYPLYLPWADVVTNMATYPMMHTTDGNNEWCRGFPNKTWCSHSVENFVDHLTPAFKYLEQVECDPTRHTVARWCGLKGQVQNMLDAGTNAGSGQLSPGVWLNECHVSRQFPTGVTKQGWTQPSLRSFLAYLDTMGVRSVDLWCDDKPLEGTCPWVYTELARWQSTSNTDARKLFPPTGRRPVASSATRHRL